MTGIPPSEAELHALVEKYSYKLTKNRKNRLDGIIRLRSRHFTIVMEDLKDAHNISAVIRTSEVFGFQDVHVIEELNPYCISKAILKGSFKWISLFRYRKRAACLKLIKEKGYQIAVANSRTGCTLSGIDLNRPTAFYLGSESLGNHPDTLKAADFHFRIPQFGLTESLNVSVCAGVLMYKLRRWIEQNGREKFSLSEGERLKLQADFYLRSAVGSDRNSPVTTIEDEPSGEA